MLVGLLYVTGLRISEALALNQNDFDIGRRLLLVRKGKLRKERYVALHPTAIDAVEAYLKRRRAYQPSSDYSPFFIDSKGKRLKYKTASTTFRRVVRQCKIGNNAPKPPRLHDLRHTYACNCVLRWYDEGIDVNSMLPVLATALGHVTIQDTQIYLHVSSRLLQQAARRFHQTFTASCKGVIE
jgi:integrase